MMQTPSLPVVSQSLAQRITDADAAGTLSWLGAMRDLPGNPFGVHIQQFGGATALVTRAIRSHMFNRVVGLSAAGIDSIDAIQQFCRSHGAWCPFDLSPFHTSPSLLAHLARSGMYQSSFGMVMYGQPNPLEPPLPQGVTVDDVGPHDLDRFVTVYRQSFGTIYGDEVRVLGGLPEWRLYTAALDDKPVAIGLLMMHGGVGVLAGGATLPGARGRGCQKALIRRRMSDAAAAGCNLMVGFCMPGSWSQSNMQRMGLQVAYTKVSWTEAGEDTR